MALCVTKDCFPAPSMCHNCARKSTSDIKKETGPKKNYKRCGNCHLMSYCDQDCQREHWIRVHKKHCRFISGKSPVQNSNHDTATCAQCVQARGTSATQILSENSPQTACTIQTMANSMKEALGGSFGFHGEGKSCNCSQEFGFNLPFPLGEVSGQYLEIASTGLEAMLAHSLKISYAMILKAKDEQRKNALNEVLGYILGGRVQLWCDVLVCGKPRFMRDTITNPLSEKVTNLQTVYGASNPWWKVLAFSVQFVLNIDDWNDSNVYDFHSLENPRFQKFKLLQNHRQSEFLKQAIVCENQIWPNFKLWPQLVNNSLTVLLPPGTRCQTCHTELSGEVEIMPDESNYTSRPGLFPSVGDNGSLVACCSRALKPNCVMDLYSKNMESRMKSDENQRKEIQLEMELFATQSRSCEFCMKASLSSHRCSGCLTVQYCSPVCQKKDLDFHKTVCSTWAKDESKQIVGRAEQKQHTKKMLANSKK